LHYQQDFVSDVPLACMV